MMAGHGGDGGGDNGVYHGCHLPASGVVIVVVAVLALIIALSKGSKHSLSNW